MHNKSIKRLNLREKRSSLTDWLPLIKEIYELEYKQSQTTNPRYLKLYSSELDRTLSQIVPVMMSSIELWFVAHESATPGEMGYAEILPSVTRRDEYYVNTFNQLKRIWHALDEAMQSTNVKDKLVAFHLALQAEHLSGSLTVDYTDKHDASEQEVTEWTAELDSLTEGTNVPQWDMELRKDAKKLNLRETNG